MSSVELSVPSKTTQHFPKLHIGAISSSETDIRLYVSRFILWDVLSMLIEPLIFLRALDLIGVFVFALSGGIPAVRKNMDVFGVLVVAFFPAVGGGTIRDLLLDQPVFWLTDPMSLLFALLGGICALTAPNFWSRLKTVVWLDAIGLSLFSMVGAYKAYSLGHAAFVAPIMGAITATGGGVVRDLLCGREVMLLKEDIYATASLIGGAVFIGCVIMGMDLVLCLIVGALIVFVIRACAIRFELNLPRPFNKDR